MTNKPLPPHGTLSRRKMHGCACEACRKADRDYMAKRSRLQAYGQWQPFVDAEPVRAHVRMLMDYGIGWQRIATLAGVSNGGLSRLLYGNYQPGKPPTKRVRIATAAKLCAVRPNFDLVAPSALVDSAGTRRRLQALMAAGWPQLRIAAAMRTHHKVIWDQMHSTTPVMATTARAVRDLYNRLWNVAPASQGVQQRYIDAARQIATNNGWLPPAAWDDDYIDSPAFQPSTELEPISKRVDVEHLLRMGIAPEAIRSRTGASAAYVREVAAEIRTGQKRDRKLPDMRKAA
ncbi:hypothetical protein ACFY7H_13245 [Streptomyces sp. NPDC012794]|uniref:hypothetical protein n=1 Tax=Streptomyces sp. NPDC012794 TaxID=3364850 RepID=UPI0036B93360